MHWIPLVLAGTLCAMAASPHGSTRRAPGQAGILAAEWAFIRHCERDGMKPAFQAAFHPEGLLFRPEPQNGRDWYARLPETPARLSWFPAVAGTAQSGDLGYTSGPWEWRERPEASATAFGWFLSVWKRDPEAGWQLLWDIGIPTRSAARGVRPLPVPGSTRPDPQPSAVPLSAEQALELDRRFAAAASARAELAYRTHLAPEGRLYRSPDPPSVGWVPARALLASRPGPAAWEPAGSAAAASGELLFVHGTYQRRPPAGPPESGTYVRAWRRLGTAWTLEFDLESPRKPAP